VASAVVWFGWDLDTAAGVGGVFSVSATAAALWLAWSGYAADRADAAAPSPGLAEMADLLAWLPTQCDGLSGYHATRSAREKPVKITTDDDRLQAANDEVDARKSLVTGMICQMLTGGDKYQAVTGIPRSPTDGLQEIRAREAAAIRGLTAQSKQRPP
jgi:hypothetical protein